MTQPATSKDNLGSLLWESCKAGDSSTDFTIRCGDRAFRVHKCVLSCRSSVFKTRCEEAVNAGKTELQLSPTEPEILESALEFLYTFNYTPKYITTSSVDGVTPKKRLRTLSHHATMYAFANTFDIPQLATAAKGAYTSRLGVNAKSLMCSHDSNSTRVAALALGILESIHIVFNATPNTDRGLRDEVIQQFKSLGPTIKKSRNAEVSAAFQKILNTEQKFKDELLMGFLNMRDLNTGGQQPGIRDGTRQRILPEPTHVEGERSVLGKLKPNETCPNVAKSASQCSQSNSQKNINKFENLLDHWETKARTRC